MMTNNILRSIYLANRADRMRRARNAAFYSQAAGLSALAVSRWQETVRAMVREARANNHLAIQSTAADSRYGVWFGGAGF